MTDSQRGDVRQIVIQLIAAGVIGAVVAYGTIQAVETKINALNEKMDAAERQRRVDQESISNAIKQVDANSASRRTETREELYNAISRLQTEVSEIRNETRKRQ